jgi:hypothetical protein
VAFAPAPIRLTDLFAMLTDPDQVAVPLVTLIVLPFGACETQLTTLVRSGVLVHEVLEPVQAASAEGAITNASIEKQPKLQTRLITTSPSITRSVCAESVLCFSPPADHTDSVVRTNISTGGDGFQYYTPGA